MNRDERAKILTHRMWWLAKIAQRAQAAGTRMHSKTSSGELLLFKIQRLTLKIRSELIELSKPIPKYPLGGPSNRSQSYQIGESAIETATPIHKPQTPTT